MTWLFPVRIIPNKPYERDRDIEMPRNSGMRADISSYIGSFFGGQFCSSRIAALLCWRRSFAVAIFVISIVVDTIKRQSWGSFSHISEKIFKNIPSFTDADASGAIIFELRVVWSVAARAHIDPRDIGSGFSSWSGMSVGASMPVSGIDERGHGGSFYERLCQGAATRVIAGRPAFYGMSVGCWL